MSRKSINALTAAQERKTLDLIGRLWTKTVPTPEQLETLLGMLRRYPYPIVDASLREAWGADTWSPHPEKIVQACKRRMEHAQAHAAGRVAAPCYQGETMDPCFERARDAIGRMNPERQRQLARSLESAGRLDKAERWAVHAGGAALRAVLVLKECERLRENSLPMTA